jgi:riboflavin kinase / FMN adenylyltransferase
MTMRIFRHYVGLPEFARGTVIALGNFDGVHLGHQTVIRTVRDIAAKMSAKPAVLTFEPHPRVFFRPNDPAFQLTPLNTKVRHLRDLGIEVLYVQHFDETLSKVTARGFVDEVLTGGMAARHLVVGEDFVFGHNREGTTAMLEAESKAGKFGITVVKPVLDAEGRVCSSTNIRHDLSAGKPEAAARLLGRCWEVEGRVAEGDKRGRTIGFPTANIGLADYVHPRYGVYAVWAGVDRGGATAWHPGVANVGKRPTFAGEKANVETYIFDIAADLYGDLLRVAFVRFLRPEQKFSGIEEIRTQIARDCRAARDVFEEIHGNALLGPPDLAPREGVQA